MTTNEVFALAERTIRSIGYKVKLPEPFLEYPGLEGPRSFPDASLTGETTTVLSS